jgi:hypothetical protein
MPDLTAQRTLVKSPPELWTELSEVESLARHLGELGEIRITRVEPESTVAWEGEQISGTVELEQSGWGTKVTIHATVPEPDQAPVPEQIVAVPGPEVAPGPVAVEPEPEITPEPVAVEPEQEPTVEFEAVEQGPDLDPEPQPGAKAKRTGFFARWLFRERQPTPEPAVAAPDPEPVVEPEPPAAEQPEPVAVEPQPVAIEPEAPVSERAEGTPDPERVQQVLDGTLDALGQAHHRPFSRG